MTEEVIYAIDLETTSLIPYDPAFKITSLAIAYSANAENIKTKFFTNIEEIENCLYWFSNNNCKIIVHNLGFEQLVFQYKYPNLKLNYHADTMRMSQLRGLPEDDDSKDRETGYSLKATTRRFLKHMANYEQEAYTWIRENLGVARGKEGAYLSKLPFALLKKYNENDVIATIQLYYYFEGFFKEEGYNWKVDWELYRVLADFVINAEIKGIVINRNALTSYLNEITEEVKEIDVNFVRKMGSNIRQVQEMLRQKLQSKYKKKIIVDLPEFNITSKKHLEMLFCNVLGIKAVVSTPKGAPSFKSAHLQFWGEGGKLLEKRGKRLLVKSQIENLGIMSDRDSRFHPKLRIVGTRSGRLSGASQKKSYGVSLNLQAIARQDKGLMTSLIPEKGNIFVSQDLVRGEPTVISFYTEDPQYKLVNCDMSGKKPYFQGEMLISDDQYLTIGSITPFARDHILNLISSVGGIAEFGELWLKDGDALKKPIKNIRKVLKMAVLAIGYGAQPNRIFKACNEAGCNISKKESEELYDAFWSMYPRVKKYTELCTKTMKRKGYMYNVFGFSFTTEPHKAYNLLAQSTINGIIAIYIQELEKLYKFIPITILHDEIIVEIPEKDVDIFRDLCSKAVDNLNNIIGWSIPVRTGFAVGKTLYEAK